MEVGVLVIGAVIVRAFGLAMVPRLNVQFVAIGVGSVIVCVMGSVMDPNLTCASRIVRLRNQN